MKKSSLKWQAALVAAGSILGSFLTISSSLPRPVQAKARVEHKAPQPGKPSAPVEVTFETPKDFAVGSDATVVFKITPIVDASALSVRWSPTPGLEVATKPMEQNLGARKQGDTASISVVVHPREEGRHYLNLFVDGTFAGQKSGQALSVAVSTPQATSISKKSAAPGNLKRDSKGRAIIETPAKHR